MFNLEGTLFCIPVGMGPELSWLERTTDNRKVGGSSPLGPTNSLNGNRRDRKRTIPRPVGDRKGLSKGNWFPFEVRSPRSGQFSAENLAHLWGYSSAGRAPALQAGGRRFDPDYLHQFRIEDGWKRTKGCTFRSGFKRDWKLHLEN